MVWKIACGWSFSWLVTYKRDELMGSWRLEFHELSTVHP